MRAVITSPYVAACLSGALLGLSAPGFGQFWLAWIGIVPLFILVFSSKNAVHAVFRGYVFGIAYNLIALNWFLHLNPPWWAITQALQQPSARLGLSIGMWIVAGFINGFVYALAACVLYLVASTSTKLKRGQSLVLIISSAFVFSLVEHTVSYIPDLLLLPLSLLEYSQFHQSSALQICAIAGGGGLCACIIAVNAALSLAFLSRFGPRLPRPLQPKFTANPSRFFIYVGTATAIVFSIFGWGAYNLSRQTCQTPITVTVVQPGTAQECDRLKSDLSAKQVYARIENLLLKCPAGLVVWPETALFNIDQSQIDSLKALSRKLHLNMIVGFLERESKGKMFNSVLAIDENGTVSDHIYRKRCLIPFGEFEPIFLRVLPAAIKKNLPSIPKFTPGKESLAIKISDKAAISPIVCGENMDSLVCAQSVASGGMIIVDLSNLEWFKYSQASEFTEAVCAVRAVENQRWLVYASDSGPSFVIDPAGRTVAFADWGEVRLLTATAEYRSEVTPFTSRIASLKFLR